MILHRSSFHKLLLALLKFCNQLVVALLPAYFFRNKQEYQKVHSVVVELGRITFLDLESSLLASQLLHYNKSAWLGSAEDLV